MYDDLEAIEAGLAAVVAALDPAVVHGPDALAALERACRITKLATTATMLLGRRVDETHAWKPSGSASAAHLLANLAGTSLGEAITLLGTATKVASLPRTDDAARQGKLSGTQLREVSKGAAADPTAEVALLDLAERASTSELTLESRRRRLAAAGDDARRHARMKAARALHRFVDDDGSAVMRWRHLPEVGAELDAILADYVDDEFAVARHEQRREQRCAYAADALVAALRDAAAFRRGESLDDEPADRCGEPLDDLDVDEALDADAAWEANESNGADEQPGEQPGDESSGAGEQPGDGSTGAGVRGRGRGRGPGVAATSPRHDQGSVTTARPRDRDGLTDPGRTNRRRRRRDGERPPGDRSRRRTRRRGADAKVIVRIDHGALIRGHTEPGEICEIAGLGPVPVASVAALMDDAFLAAVVIKGHDVHTVAHLGRQPNAYQQTALQSVGVRCAVLGCPNTRRLERDHREDWARTRHTRLDELDWLCGHHHDLKTRSDHQLVPGSGPRELLSPAQRRLRTEPNAADESPPAQPASLEPAGAEPSIDGPATGVPPASRPTAPAPNRRPSAPRRTSSPPEALTLDV